MKNSHFCAGIFVVIFFAKLNPDIGNVGGILKPEITVKYITVSLIFLASGLSLPIKDLFSALWQWDIHLFIQGFTFIIFPALVKCLVLLLQFSAYPAALLDGMTILSTMPPPVSSAMILTKAVGGNEAAALFNSVFGSILGIFMTPLLIMLLLDSSAVDIPTNKIFQQLCITVVVPLVIGLIIHHYHSRWLHRKNIPFKTILRCLILYIIYTTFCSTFSRTDIHLDTFYLIVTVLLMFFLQISLEAILLLSSHHGFGYKPEDTIAIMFVGMHKNLTIVFCIQLIIMYCLLFISSHSMFKFTSTDSVAITFCGCHKSLTLGIPMIEVIFEGDPRLIFMSIPLLIYNPMQIVLGGMSVPLFSEWLRNQAYRRRRQDFRWHHV